MKILAIDPGPVQSAWVSYYTDSRVVDAHGIAKNCEVKREIIAKGHAWQWLAIEMVQSYGMAVGRSVFETVFWTGRFAEAWSGPFDLIYRSDVKMCLCHDSRANDANIRAAIIDRYPATGGGKRPAIGTKAKPGPLYGIKADEWSALAVALCWVDTRKEKP